VSYFIFISIYSQNMTQLTDQYDLEILTHLEKDGRIPFSTIATAMAISNTMVHQRISKMMDLGILKGVKPVLDEKKLGFDWASFTGITLDKDHNSERIIESLKSIPEVTECYYVTGAYTLFVRISAKNHEHMRKILYEKIDNIPGVSKTDSIMELGCAFRRNIGLNI
jgi:Lrp/AsnC family transcriptional regulator for asnA, asnC and gidA